MIKTNKRCYFISSDKYEGSKLLDDILKHADEYKLETEQIMILTNLEDDIKFASAYPEFDYMICNKPGDKNTELEDRFNCALTFIENNHIQDYVLILDR